MFIAHQIWRPKDDGSDIWLRIHNTDHEVTAPGIQTISVSELVHVQKGDVVGIYTGTAGTIPFQYVSCENTMTVAFVYNTVQDTGPVYIDPIYNDCRHYSIRVTYITMLETAIERVGHKVIERVHPGDEASYILLLPHLSFARPGLLTEWQAYTTGTGTVHLQVCNL